MHPHSPPREEGWTRHQENVAKPPYEGADGVVGHTEICLVSDHPVCGGAAATPPHEEGTIDRRTFRRLPPTLRE